MDAKRVRGGLLAAGAAFVAVLVVALLLFFVSGDEADLSYRSVDFDAQLQSNGDIRFTEHLDYQLKRRENDDGDTKPWKQLYQTFKLRKQDLTNITDISVTNASTGEQYTQIAPQLPSDVSDSEWESEYAGHWYIADTTIGSNYPEPFDSATGGLDPTGSDNDKQIDIGWNIPATVKQRSLKFDVTMTFHNMGTQHSDVTNLMWEMFPEDNQVPAGKVTGTVRFPIRGHGCTLRPHLKRLATRTARCISPSVTCARTSTSTSSPHSTMPGQVASNVCVPATIWTN